jgi:ABC-type uncharacterized transport system ATPase subunit
MDIELKHIHKRFGAVHANNDISLTVNAGKIVAVLGENGAGKSTLMKILSGYQPADSGEIVLNGTPARYRTPQGAIAAGIGMLQQDPLDVPAFTVLENFVYGQKTGFIYSSRVWRERFDAICGRLGFQLDADQPIAGLSIGQRQQLEIVRLLSMGVRTLILDEPTTGISAEQKTILFDALRALAQNDGMSILLVSHKLEDVIALCTSVVVLRGGRLVGTLDMPATTTQLVRLMFGQELAPPAHECLINPNTAVTLDNVTLKGKRVTVENFSLRIRSCEVIGLAGLEESGQDLILRACVGLVKPARGHVLIGDENMTGKSYRDFLAAGIAFGAAGRLEEGLIAGLTLTEHIALATEMNALVDWQRAKTLTDARLKQYNVRGRPDSQIETLSGGNQQRLLMALMPEKPALMALEQPTRGLDVDSSRWIWQQLLERRAGGTAILFSSPDLDELVTYSDRIFVAYAGHIVEIPDARQTNIDELGRLIGGHFEKATAL